MELIPLGTFTVELARKGIFDIGDGPAGKRIIFEVESGRFEGDRLKANIKGSAGADWSVTDANGTMTLDVRCTLETDASDSGDSALIYMTYSGRADFSDGPGTKPIYTAIMFETTHDDYRWLNNILAVSKGTATGPLSLTYTVHHLS